MAFNQTLQVDFLKIEKPVVLIFSKICRVKEPLVLGFWNFSESKNVQLWFFQKPSKELMVFTEYMAKNQMFYCKVVWLFLRGMFENCYRSELVLISLRNTVIYNRTNFSFFLKTMVINLWEPPGEPSVIKCHSY